jgi:hypothetical protein
MVSQPRTTHLPEIAIWAGSTSKTGQELQARPLRGPFHNRASMLTVYMRSCYPSESHKCSRQTRNRISLLLLCRLMQCYAAVPTSPRESSWMHTRAPACRAADIESETLLRMLFGHGPTLAGGNEATVAQQGHAGGTQVCVSKERGVS